MYHETTTNKNVLTALALIATALAGCSSTPTFQTGADAEVTFDGLTRMEGTIMDVVWARTDIDLTSYSKVMLEGLGVEYREVSGPYSGRAGAGSSRIQSGSQTEFKLDADTRALFEEEISGAFLEAMARSNVFEVDEEAGPEVLLIRVEATYVAFFPKRNGRLVPGLQFVRAVGIIRVHQQHDRAIFHHDAFE